MSNAFEDYFKYFEGLTFSKKLEEIKKLEKFNDKLYLSAKTSSLSYDGYLRAYDRMAVCQESGDHYVYIWKHAWGDPFYVGCGVNDRWKSKASRCDDFYHCLDAGDAVVYKVLDGVDSKTARTYERYVSANISNAGYVLSNGDNNAARKSDAAKKRLLNRCNEIQGTELTKKVEKAVIDILRNKEDCDHRITQTFLKEYGTEFFSRTYSSIAV